MAALEGDLGSFPITQLLAMLAATSKTGRLSASGAWSGWMALRAGAVVAAEALGDTEPAVVALHLRRLGPLAQFRFEVSWEHEEAGTGSGPTTTVEQLLGALEHLEREWAAIEEVLASRHATIRLSAELAHDQVTLGRREWELVAAASQAGWLGGVVQLAGGGELACARELKALVEAGLLVVGPEAGGAGEAQPGGASLAVSGGAGAWMPEPVDSGTATWMPEPVVPEAGAWLPELAGDPDDGGELELRLDLALPAGAGPGAGGEQAGGRVGSRPTPPASAPEGRPTPLAPGGVDRAALLRELRSL